MDGLVCVSVLLCLCVMKFLGLGFKAAISLVEPLFWGLESSFFFFGAVETAFGSKKQPTKEFWEEEEVEKQFIFPLSIGGRSPQVHHGLKLQLLPAEERRGDGPLGGSLYPTNAVCLVGIDPSPLGDVATGQKNLGTIRFIWYSFLGKSSPS